MGQDLAITKSIHQGHAAAAIISRSQSSPATRRLLTISDPISSTAHFLSFLSFIFHVECCRTMFRWWYGGSFCRVLCKSWGGWSPMHKRRLRIIRLLGFSLVLFPSKNSYKLALIKFRIGSTRLFSWRLRKIERTPSF